MADAVRRAVTAVSEHVFPGISYHTEAQRDSCYKLGNEVVANLPLQMALYFNVCFFPFWLMCVITMLQLKYDCLTSLYQFVLFTVLVAVSIVEVVRLYLGYLGNLTEKVPELAGFWLLTLLLQLPLQGFLLLNEDTLIQPMERAVNVVMVTFVLTELAVGYWALWRIARHQACRFHLQQLECGYYPNEAT